MTQPKIFLSSNSDGVQRVEQTGDQWQSAQALQGKKINCLALDPSHSQRVYAGVQPSGVQISDDFGLTWQQAGSLDVAVKSLAVHPCKPQTIYAGCKPAALYVTHNGGETWDELPGLRRARRWWWFSPADPPDWTPYVQALAISPSEPQVLIAGIEVGGVLRSQDGGQTWSKAAQGAVLDCHSLKFHASNSNWVYEGGGGGAAVSIDGGRYWRKPSPGLNRKYGWMVAADPALPEVWYHSASFMPNLLRGDFVPPAHQDGRANAGIYRMTGGGAWELLSGGLPEPLHHMPFALLTDREQPGHVYAGLSDGSVWQSRNYGDAWDRLPFEFSSGLRLMLMTGGS